MIDNEFIKLIANPGEDWEFVPGYENMYAVSTLGRIATLKEGGTLRSKNLVYPKVLTPTLSDTGYLRVSLYTKYPNRKVESVHRLVAKTFIQNPDPETYTQVDHINTNRKDNRVENLQWCSPKMNANNPLTRVHNSKSSKGHIRWNSKKIAQIKDSKIIKIYETIYAAGLAGFNESSICHCCNHRQSRHKGFEWQYLDEINLSNYDQIDPGLTP